MIVELQTGATGRTCFMNEVSESQSMVSNPGFVLSSLNLGLGNTYTDLG